MTIPARSTSLFASFSRASALKWAFLTAIVAVTAGAPQAVDARARMAPGVGAYDGTWNVMFSTLAGGCNSNSFPFIVTGTQVSSAGGGRVTGGVSRSGAVAVTVTVGASSANGRGRLYGNSGTGRWSGVISGDRCSGSWQASRG